GDYRSGIAHLRRRLTIKADTGFSNIACTGIAKCPDPRSQSVSREALQSAKCGQGSNGMPRKH
ncbi:MAG: hypothetical protein RIC89_15510, partial [Pseudomonadales bacterium]